MAALVLFCAALLAASALHKATSRGRLAEAAARLAGVGPVPGQLLLILAGPLELVAAACLLARRRGETLDCGCDLAVRTKPVTTALVLRAAGLALLAGIVALIPDAAITLDAPFAAAGLLALYLGAGELLAIPAAAWKTSLGKTA